jgi:hypothetical protein
MGDEPSSFGILSRHEHLIPEPGQPIAAVRVLFLRVDMQGLMQDC